MAAKRSRRQRSAQTGVKHPIDCSRIQPMLFDYLSHELGARQSMLVREHLRHCEACSREAGELQGVVTMMRRNDPGAGAPAAVTGRRRRRMFWLMGHPFVSRCVSHPRITAFVAAVVVLVAVFLFLLTIRTPDFIRRDLPRYPVQLEGD